MLKHCKCSQELCATILGFFKKFDKHTDNFIRILGDLIDQGIQIKDVLSIVVQLFMSADFAKDVTYGNFLSLIEFVTKFILDEAVLSVAREDYKCEGTIELPFELQVDRSIKGILQRPNLVSDIAKRFNEIRKYIIDDNAKNPLELDFGSIFA